jgi:carbon storage regulator
MLVLSRKSGEEIVVNSEITITVVSIDRGKVRLGFSCDRKIPIYRRELLNEEGKPVDSSSEKPK